MAHKFLPLFADMEELTEELTDRERGQLLRAMFAYFFRGEEVKPQGNARYVWPAVRRTLDQCIEKADINRVNGAKGWQTRRERAAAKAQAPACEDIAPTCEAIAPTCEAIAPTCEAIAPTCEANHKQEQDQQQKQEHKQEHQQEQQEHARGMTDASPTSPATAEEAFFTDGEEDAKSDAADESPEPEQRFAALMRRYGLPEGPVSLRALRKDVAAYGFSAVERALAEAGASNSRPKLSVNFYRAVLKNQMAQGNLGDGAGGGGEGAAFQNGMAGCRGGPASYGAGTASYGAGTASYGAGTASYGAGAARYGTGTAKYGTGPAKCGTGTAGMLRYTPEERRQTYNAAIVDLDAEE